MRRGGWAAVRGDFRRYCGVHGARTAARKLCLPFTASSLFALAVYRYGSWVYCGGSRTLLHRALYRVFADAARHFTKVLIPIWAELDDEVWLGSGAPLIVGARVGRGACIHAGASLGLRVGGMQYLCEIPEIGPGAVIGPGASITGAVHVAAGAVIGPNSVVTRSLPPGAVWLGVPAVPFHGAASALVPAAGGSS